MRGLLAVAIGLIALQVLVTSKVSGLAGAAAYPAQLAAKWMDPAVPLISPRNQAPAPRPVPAQQTPQPIPAAAQHGAATAGLINQPAYLGAR